MICSFFSSDYYRTSFMALRNSHAHSAVAVAYLQSHKNEIGEEIKIRGLRFQFWPSAGNAVTLQLFTFLERIFATPRDLVFAAQTLSANFQFLISNFQTGGFHE